jgi:hypothetical protein
MDEPMITRESRPVTRKEGDRVVVIMDRRVRGGVRRCSSAGSVLGVEQREPRGFIVITRGLTTVFASRTTS